jgi:hypothetical protein
MPATVPLEVRKTAAEKRLTDLRAQRGAAIVDGQEFDRHDEITAAERDLAGINEAIDEAVRRARSATVKADVTGYHRLQHEYRRAENTRLSAVDQTEAACKVFAGKVKEAFDAAAAGAAAQVELMHRIDPRASAIAEPDVSRQHFAVRLAAYIKATLRETLGEHWLGTLDLSAQPGDLEPGRPWREGEGRGSHDHFERHAPRGADEISQRDAAGFESRGILADKNERDR